MMLSVPAKSAVNQGPSWAIVRSRLLFMLLMLLVVGLFAACGTAVPPTPLGTQTVDASSMKQMLTLQDIQQAGGDTSRLHVNVQDVKAVAATLNPDQAQGVHSWYAMKIERGSSSATLIFTFMEFDSPEQASARLSQIEGGLGFKSMDPPVANASALLTSGAGTGLTFVKGSRMVTLETTNGDLSDPILDTAGIERLARIIAGRL